MRLFILIVLLSSLTHASFEQLLLVIGNNVGLANEIPLNYADSDARRVYETLIELGGVDKERSYLLLNKNKMSILYTFREMAGRIKELKRQGKQVVAFVYYSGHGSDGSFHIMGEDLPIDTVRDFFDGMDADLKILVADACNSGALLSSKGGTVGNTYDLKWKNDLTVKGSVILTSSSASEFSHESRELKGSLFTHYLVSGLRGGADFDNDRKVSLWEGFTYTRRNITRHTMQTKNSTQTPEFDFNIRGTENVTLTSLSNGKAFLLFKSCKPGRYKIIESKTGVFTAELNLTNEDSIVTIAIPQGQYLVQYPQARAIYLADANLLWGGTKEIDERVLKPYPLDALRNKGSELVAYKSNRVSVTSWFINDFAYHEGKLAFPGLSYSREGFNIGASIGAGYGSDDVYGKYLSVKRSTMMLNAQLRFYQIQRARYALFVSSSATIMLLHQKSRRPDETEIKNAGYSVIPDKYGQYGCLGLGLGTKINLPMSLSMIVGSETTLLFYRNVMGDMSYNFRLPLYASIGIDF